MKQAITKEFIRKLPKTDLHVHLDGSVRLETLIELSREAHLSLPSYTVDGLYETVFMNKFVDLAEVLACFQYTIKVMQNAEQLSRIAYELALDNQAEGVRYVEVRFAPHLHVHDDFDTLRVLRAVDEGLGKAKAKFNASESVCSGTEPEFDYGIIACAMRYFNEHSSKFYSDFIEKHRLLHSSRIYDLASRALVRSTVSARDKYGVRVVGVDLAGQEHGYPARDHQDAFLSAQRHFLRKTVHAGEAYGAESIYQAIVDLHAERIGHGTSLLNPKAIRDVRITDPKEFVKKMTQFIAELQIALEICLTSNQQTNPAYQDLRNHPFGKMMKYKLALSICTDNRTISRTTVTDELYKAVQTFDLGLEDVNNILLCGFTHSFFPRCYTEKLKYIRSCMNYLNKVEKDFV